MKFLLRVGAACRALIEKPSFARFIAFGLGELLQTHSQATESLVLVPGRSGSLVLSSWAVSTVVMFPIIVDGSIRIAGSRVLGDPQQQQGIADMRERNKARKAELQKTS